MIFVNSMSDLFHKDVPVAFIQRVFDIMRRAEWHTFQVLTKRSERLAQLDRVIDWPKNVWMGVSVETMKYAPRIDHLRGTGALTKFLSLEPLLGPMLDLDLDGIAWVILGASLDRVRDRCRSSGCARYVRSADARRLRSSSSSGADSTRRRPAANSTVARGTTCRTRRSPRRGIRFHYFDHEDMPAKAWVEWPGKRGFRRFRPGRTELLKRELRVGTSHRLVY
jgi:hypothetical protein